jgi:FKBP-type peptidyl-prolyl cis-trans isomerase
MQLNPVYIALVALVALAPCAGAQAPVGAGSASPVAAPSPAGASSSEPANASSIAIPSIDEASRLFGVDFGRQIRDLGIAGKIPADAVMRGLKQGLDGTSTTTEDDIHAVQAYVKSVKQAANADHPAAPPLGTPSDQQAGVIYGVNFGLLLRRLGIRDHLSLDAIAGGLKEGLAGTKTMTAESTQALQTYVRSSMKAAADTNKAAAQTFLAANRDKKGVKTTADGLQYKVLEAGDRKGISPNPNDIVTVQYRGTLLDGTEFDSSYKRGSPTTLPLTGVIKGWQEALVLMKPGAKWQLFVPPELGYGDASRQGLPADSLLTFEVELVSVEKAKLAGDGAPAMHPETRVN